MRCLYHLWLSPFCRKVRLVLGEKGLDFDMKVEKTWERRPDFLAMNPAGQVPVLVEDDDVVLVDSGAICNYLEEVYPDSDKPLLGRDPVCDFQIKNETVSARHARLSYHHKQWWIEDLNSTNGTFLNEEPLYTATVIVSGDEIRCGQVDILVSIGDKSGQEFPVK